MEFFCCSGWDQLPDSAEALFAQAEQENLFYSRSWLEAVTATLSDDQTLLLAGVMAGDSLLALLPLVRSHGKNYLALKHRYTTHYSLLVLEQVHNRPQILSCLVQGLRQIGVHSLLLEPVAGDDSRITDLQQCLETQGYRCQQLFRFYNWIQSLPGMSFADYMAARPTSLRNTIARKQRKLEREHGYTIRLYKGDEVPQAMSDYYQVYTASWKANEQYVAFLDGVVTGFSRRDWSRLAVLYVDEQPVAAQLWFVLHGKASIFRLAYDQAWKQYSPGSIVSAYLLEYVIDRDKVVEIDFLTGNEAYKQDWMSERRERYVLSCVQHKVAAGRFKRWIGTLKRMLRQ